jgi:hypothetical protein
MGGEKACVSCGVVQPFDQFYRRKDNGALTGECKSCKVARSRRYYRENTEAHNAVVKKRYDNFGRFQRYGITKELYDKTLQEQGGVCALCASAEPGGKGTWHIDHAHPGTHKTGIRTRDGGRAFRGILCHDCNVNLGAYEKLIRDAGIEKLQRYLDRVKIE